MKSKKGIKTETCKDPDEMSDKKLESEKIYCSEEDVRSEGLCCVSSCCCCCC